MTKRSEKKTTKQAKPKGAAGKKPADLKPRKDKAGEVKGGGLLQGFGSGGPET